MLGYRRETVLQGALVLAKSGRLDIIGLSSTTVTKWAYKAIEFGEKRQNKGC